MSTMRVGTLLKNGLSTIETLISMALLLVFTLFMMLVNKMQSDQAELESIDSTEKVDQKRFATNPSPSTGKVLRSIRP